MRDIFRGQLVRLSLEEPGAMARAEVRWQRDTEFHRLADAEPPVLQSRKKMREQIEKQAESLEPDRFHFSVRTLDPDRLIGSLSLWVDWVHREGWVGLGIGERELWSRGYGTDVMKLALQYVFAELCLERLSLGVHSYNPRALRSYEKCGFLLEGRTRQDVLREGRRSDSLWMGILRHEWMARQAGANQ